MDELYKLNEFLEQKVKDDIIKETTYLDINNYLKKISDTISSLNSQVNILGQETKLDLIELLLKEAMKDLEDFDTESPYLVLASQQLRRLRNCTED